MSKPKHVTVFGGSAPKPDEPAYQAALRLGELLGAAGYTVLNGGYIGTMEAVSRGASQAGGHVIGVTCDEIEAWRPVAPNAYLSEEMRFPTVRSRLFALIENCDGAIALPGGAGTLAEIAMMWNQLQTAAISPRPLVLVGAGWQRTFAEMFATMPDYVPAEHRAYLSFAPDVAAAFTQIKELLKN